MRRTSVIPSMARSYLPHKQYKKYTTRKDRFVSDAVTASGKLSNGAKHGLKIIRHAWVGGLGQGRIEKRTPVFVGKTSRVSQQTRASRGSLLRT